MIARRQRCNPNRRRGGTRGVQNIGAPEKRSRTKPSKQAKRPKGSCGTTPKGRWSRKRSPKREFPGLEIQQAVSPEEEKLMVQSHGEGPHKTGTRAVSEMRVWGERTVPPARCGPFLGWAGSATMSYPFYTRSF